MDLQAPDKKMSKSLPPAGCVFLLDDPKVTAKKIRSAVTDTGREVVADPVGKPGITNLLTIHSALSGTSIRELEERFAGRGYGDLKKELAEVVVDFVTPVRQRTQELLDDPAELERTLARGAARAREVAARTVADAYDKVGFLPPAGAPA
jgi:tryptophanyl-tRNA synthetase